ncbi:two-component system histidine kinase PnpS [Ornithinibacillus californiensis]|uniref:two-component system histidine kinase PnpS n=1 Tax=Ornithinibacillus californiensis TaxID=161536 RepID=UPI00064DF598|nr:ATP-binding protein [Ornithinibacillus californiensis]
MRFLSLKPIIRYAIIIFMIVAITGIIFSQFMENYIVIVLVLLTEYIILMMMLNYVFEKYVKPIKKATDTLDELVRGNFRARMHHPVTGSMASLLMKINKLARSLSELSINEKIHAEQLTTVIENIQSGLVLIDEKGYIHLVNKNFLNLFGKNDGDFIGYLYYDVLDNEKIHKTIQQTFLYEETVKDSVSIEKKEKLHFEIIGAPIFDEKNILKGAVLVLYEITELKKLETMRKDFVANVSHELKTPITSIRGFSETLLDDDLSDKEIARHFLGIINEESKRLQTLIQDLLTLSKLEKEDSRLELTDLNFEHVVQEVIPVLKQQADKNGIILQIDCPENLKFKADRTGIKQVIINLIANAISYTPKNGEVTLLVEEQEKYIHLMVRDTGIGIPKEALTRIFERFYRVDKARSRNTGGTGLGLAIVKHIVELHNGKIEVESEVNVGTTFHIYFPKEKASLQ